MSHIKSANPRDHVRLPEADVAVLDEATEFEKAVDEAEKRLTRAKAGNKDGWTQGKLFTLEEAFRKLG